jgi:hypothetical protein
MSSVDSRSGYAGLWRGLGIARKAEPHNVLEGQASLVLPDGRSIPLTARLSVSRSFFSVTGGGQFTCDEAAAFDAMNCEEAPRLVFSGHPATLIKVKEIRTSDSQCHCWFEVQS